MPRPVFWEENGDGGFSSARSTKRIGRIQISETVIRDFDRNRHSEQAKQPRLGACWRGSVLIATLCLQELTRNKQLAF
jgi:hypothetical protein